MCDSESDNKHFRVLLELIESGCENRNALAVAVHSYLQPMMVDDGENKKKSISNLTKGEGLGTSTPPPPATPYSSRKLDLPIQCSSTTSHNGLSLLELCVVLQNLPAAKILLESSEECTVDFLASFTCTPLCKLCYTYEKNYEFMKLLLEYGANPDATTNNDSASASCLIISVVKDNLDGVKLLLHYGADVTYEWRGANALSMALDFKKLDIVEALEKHEFQRAKDNRWRKFVDRKKLEEQRAYENAEKSRKEKEGVNIRVKRGDLPSTSSAVSQSVDAKQPQEQMASLPAADDAKNGGVVEGSGKKFNTSCSSSVHVLNLEGSPEVVVVHSPQALRDVPPQSSNFPHASLEHDTTSTANTSSSSPMHGGNQGYHNLLHQGRPCSSSLPTDAPNENLDPSISAAQKQQVFLLSGDGVETSNNRQQQSQQLPDKNNASSAEVTDTLNRMDWIVDAKDLELGSMISSGAHGAVYRGEIKPTGDTVAVKVFPCNEAKSRQSFRQEALMLSKFRHENVVMFKGAVICPEMCCVLSELCKENLMEKILRPGPIPWKERLRWARDIARAMSYLHSRNPPLVHRDLKSMNVLLDAKGTVKLCDFGMARWREHTYIATQHISGSPSWMAPEVLRGDDFNDKSDVYSFGVILWELITRDIPWPDKNMAQLVGLVGFSNLRLKLPSTLPEGCPSQLVPLMESCWLNPPDDRPSFRTLRTLLENLLDHDDD